MISSTASQMDLHPGDTGRLGVSGSAGLDDALSRLVARVGHADPVSRTGSVAAVRGTEVEVKGLAMRIGASVMIAATDGAIRGEVIGVTPGGGIVATFADVAGLGQGDEVSIVPDARVVAGPALLGRVVDGFGQPLDDGPPIEGKPISLVGLSPNPLSRRRIDQPLATGVRVLDLLCPAGRGQRLGLFGGSGVGKSTLLGMMARGTDADVNVIAMIGERGREVREMVEDELGPEGLASSVVVVATSDQPAILRRRAADLALRYAEYFADDGRDVLMLFDSLTRLAMAQRELGLAAGEPPTARGYTPSVFSMLPALLERTGTRATGSITGYFTVLVDGDDMNDPIADAARSILDGHIVLDRRLAHRGQYPAVDPLASLSRLADQVTGEEQMAVAAGLRRALAAVADVRDLVEVGAYVPGTNHEADAGLLIEGDLRALLGQSPTDLTSAEDAWSAAAAIMERVS